MKNVKVIALYLPQFHPTPHNDEWWGKGFTEWTNVGKAKVLFKGHEQPRVPTELGYYDLRLPEIREQQAAMAKEAGISAFCYYHYWFGNGNVELERPFQEVLDLGKPDLPFCLCWANETWHTKFWNIDGTISKKPLIEQLYPGEKDIVDHFNYVLPAFKDDRYLKIKGKPIFVIYSPLKYKNCAQFIEVWNRLAKKECFQGVHFVAYSLNASAEYDTLINLGFDAVDSCYLGERRPKNRLLRKLYNFKHQILKQPRVYDYRKIYHSFVTSFELKSNVYPTIIPNWDHTPRSSFGGYLYSNSSPEYFRKHVEEILAVLSKKNEDERICFLKSWNEWGEGNYMEPDLRYGRAYIETFRSTIDSYE